MKKVLFIILTIVLFGCTSRLDVPIPDGIKVPCVIFYTTDGCGWCRKFEPIWNEVKQDDSFKGITFYENSYQFDSLIHSYPSFIFIDRNKQVIKRVGYMGKSSFKKHLRKIR